MDIGEGEPTLHFRDYLLDLATSRKNVEAHGTPVASQLDESSDDDAEGAENADSDASDEEQDVVRSRARPVLLITEVSHRGAHVVLDYLYGRQLGYTYAGYSEVNEVDRCLLPTSNRSDRIEQYSCFLKRVRRVSSPSRMRVGHVRIRSLSNG